MVKIQGRGRGGRRAMPTVAEDASAYMTSQQFSDMFHPEKFGKSAAVLQAIALEDRENVYDLNDMAKTTRTVDMDSERFACILSEYSKKQHSQKRLYLQTLPYYIEEKNQRIDKIRGQGSQSPVQTTKSK